MIIELFVWIPDYIVQICDVIIYKKGHLQSADAFVVPPGLEPGTP